MKSIKLHRDERGAATVELAMTLPIIFLFIYGIFQVAAVFAANAVMQGALGEGARYATVWPAHTDAEIKTRIQSKVFAVYAGNFTVGDPVTTSTAASGLTPAKKTTVMTIDYTITPNFMLFTGPPLTISRSKTAYVTTVPAA